MAFLALGLIDDLRPFSPAGKILGQVLIAAFAAWSGVRADLFGNELLDICVSAFWIILLVNAVNLTDVCDGRAGGLAAIGLTTAGMLAPDFAMPMFATGRECRGFLIWTTPPAKD